LAEKKAEVKDKVATADLKPHQQEKNDTQQVSEVIVIHTQPPKTPILTLILIPIILLLLIATAILCFIFRHRLCPSSPSLAKVDIVTPHQLP
jgi:hypothetical protein